MKRILTIALLLFTIGAGAQTLPGYFSPIASPYDYQWLRTRYLRLPLDTLTGADVGAIAYKNGALYVKSDAWTALGAGGGGGSYFAGYGLLLASNTFKADTFALTTRLWHNKGLDSLAGVFGATYYTKAASDGKYSLLGHTHTASQVTDFTTSVRNAISAGSGISYNATTGVISTIGGGTGSYLFSAPLSESAGTVSITQANGSTNGYLSATDWNTFNNKQGTITANYPLYINSNVIGIDTAIITTKDRVRAMIDSANTAFGSRLYDTYNTHDTLTQSRTVWLNNTYGITFTVDGTLNNATGINNVAFDSKRGNSQLYGQNGWVYGQLQSGNYTGRIQVNGLANDSTYSASLFSSNNTTYNRKAANVSASWSEGVKLQANVNWTTSGSTSGYKGIYVYSTAGDGTGQVKIDREVLSTGASTDSAIVRKPDGTLGLYPVGSGGGGASYTPTITTASTSQTLSTDYETWVFTGSSAATFTLPASGTRYVIKSRGTAFLTVSGTMFTTSAQSSLTLYPGEATTLQWDGTYWIAY